MKKALDEKTISSVHNLLAKINNLASRPSLEFNKYEALDLLKALKNAAHDAHHRIEQGHVFIPIMATCGASTAIDLITEAPNVATSTRSNGNNERS